MQFEIEVAQTKHSFEVRLREKYPYQAPLVFCKSLHLQPLNDGRDLITAVLTQPWKATNTIYELVSRIPDFITNKSSDPDCGVYHLGQNYEMALWHSNP